MIPVEINERGRSGKPRKIVVVGGTHGNEKGGIWTVRHMRERDWAAKHPGLELRTVIANPDAESRNLRYVDRDLNRCFGPELANARLDHPHLERRLALSLAEEIAPGGLRPDLVVDLHNTTAAMGITWILPSLEAWPLYLGWRARSLDPRVRILHTPETDQSNIFVPSLGRREITLEIGPVPHGTLSHWAWDAARSQVEGILRELSELPDDFDPASALQEARFEFFQTVSIERYPLDPSGRPAALIHSSAIGRDYHPLASGDPLYFDPIADRALPYEGPTVHPVFLGEAAYVESGIAFHATRRFQWDGIKGVPC